ncbi:DUF5615 family PIN-like protein [Candidatus Woesearchaeota archaeon]|nr:DUF5615 family PIN-like protein [Candidatus Neomarinimicrobiota bacterium]MBT4731398.1 DUF5615 family PIN-like protein [Candidatus Woesearchaeota archaeon]MBT6226986.1 DUF5615 family PIN-like protein [Candidatus Scalindua sp.]MBT6562134.1 DUF5615 family PIN-like protein [Candidatus Scalindua sp.]MBT7211530.1 DUF5615 family PIN-like protein [Candidatus Scalindua sp.]
MRKIGWKSIKIPEIMDKKTKDREILTYAKKNNKVLISHNLDF